MRCIDVDGLVVVRTVSNARKHEVLPRRHILLLSNVVVRPVEHDRGLTRGDSCRGRVDRQEVARLIQLGEEINASLKVIEVATELHGCEADPCKRCSGLGRIAVQRNRALVLSVQQIFELLGRRNQVTVIANRHQAGVVVDPQSACFLVFSRNVVPGLHLVGRKVLKAVKRNRCTQIEHVRSGVLPLQVLGGLDFFRTRNVRGGGVDGDSILLLECGNDLAVVCPVLGKRDDIELALGLCSRDQCVETAEVLGARCRGGVNISCSPRSVCST